MSPLPGLLTSDTPTTTGTCNVPSAMWPALFTIAFAPRPRPAASPASRASAIVPPFRVSAFAATLIPSGSASDAATRYRNTSRLVPVPRA